MRKAHKAVAGVTAPAMTAALPLAGLQPAAGSPPGDPGPTVSDPSTVGPHELPNRLEDKHMWWSESGDDLENTMSRPVDLTAATTAARTLKARYEIEAGFDYLYVQASIDGAPWRSRVQVYDAPFSLTKPGSFTLHNGRASFIRGQNAQPAFDDSRPYWSPQIPQTGVKVPDSGTRIRVVSVDGTSMRIGVSSR